MAYSASPRVRRRHLVQRIDALSGALGPGKTMGKPWENHGKWWENGGFNGILWDFNGFYGILWEPPGKLTVCC